MKQEKIREALRAIVEAPDEQLEISLTGISFPQNVREILLRHLSEDKGIKDIKGESIEGNREELLTVKEVSQHLSITPQWVRQICAKSNLGNKMGRDLFLTTSEMQLISKNLGKRGRPPRVSE